jgi:hypothetical protein
VDPDVAERSNCPQKDKIIEIWFLKSAVPSIRRAEYLKNLKARQGVSHIGIFLKFRFFRSLILKT